MAHALVSYFIDRETNCHISCGDQEVEGLTYPVLKIGGVTIFLRVAHFEQIRDTADAYLKALEEPGDVNDDEEQTV